MEARGDAENPRGIDRTGRTSELGRFSVGGRLTVPSLPFDVGHLKQGNIVFQGNAFEIIQR